MGSCAVPTSSAQYLLTSIKIYFILKYHSDCTYGNGNEVSPFQTIRGELNRLKQLLALEKQSERSMYQRMVGDLTGRNGKKDNRTVSKRLHSCQVLTVT